MSLIDKTKLLTNCYGFNDVTANAYSRSRGKCTYCNIDIFKDYFLYYNCEIDHIYPTSKYKSLQWDLENNVLSCQLCNHLKHNLDPKDIDLKYGTDIESILHNPELKCDLIHDICVVKSLSIERTNEFYKNEFDRYISIKNIIFSNSCS